MRFDLWLGAIESLLNPGVRFDLQLGAIESLLDLGVFSKPRTLYYISLFMFYLFLNSMWGAV